MRRERGECPHSLSGYGLPSRCLECVRWMESQARRAEAQNLAFNFARMGQYGYARVWLRRANDLPPMQLP